MAQLMWRCQSKLPPFAGVLTIPPRALGDRKGPGKAARPTALAPKPELFRNSRLHLLPSRALQLSLPPSRGDAVKLRLHTAARGPQRKLLAQSHGW